MKNTLNISRHLEYFCSITYMMCIQASLTSLLFWILHSDNTHSPQEAQLQVKKINNNPFIHTPSAAGHVTCSLAGAWSILYPFLLPAVEKEGIKLLWHEVAQEGWTVRCLIKNHFASCAKRIGASCTDCELIDVIVYLFIKLWFL